ncbi:MAG: rod shape-determining protein MreC [Vogesella sp.]|uniref:rod shape-determining protein MreC n=1 Tax=Vogesella sp. TaxID=1904252 RepID=UPI0039189D40
MNFATTPSFANQGLRPGSQLLLCVLASLTLIVGDSQFGLMDRTRDALSVVLYPLQRAVNMPLSAAAHVGEFFVTQTQLKQENADLRSRELAQSARLARLNTVEQELLQLKALNGLRLGNAQGGKLGEVLYTARDPFSYKIIIDKGLDANISAGLPVVDERGLLGQVTRVQPLTAEVTLIIDKNQMVPVRNQRTGQRSLLYGYGGGVEVRYLPAAADIQPGDLLVTSGIDNLYSEGIPVARVTRVDRPAGASFARVLCQSIAGVQSSRYVLILPPRAAVPPRPDPAVTTAKAQKKKNTEDEG